MARSYIPSNVASSTAIFTTGNGDGVVVGGGVFNLGILVGARAFSQSATASSSPSTFLEIEDVTLRVLDMLQSPPFIDPSKLSPAVSLKDDLQLDMLEKVEVMEAVEEEFAVDIPDK